MCRKLLFLLMMTFFSFGLVFAALAADKVALSTAVKVYPGYYLPVLAAEEKGFWKDNGLEVEWVPFPGTAAQFVAVAARASNIGLTPSDGAPVAAERGSPVFMVAELIPREPFLVWVKADSPYRHPRDLKGTKFGTPRLGGTSHAFGRIVARAYGIEKDMRFIGAGGLPEMYAALRAGALDVIAQPISLTVGMKMAGIIREIGSMADYLPKPWLEHVIFARKDYARSNPDLVRRTIKATLQATDFMKKDSRWTIDKMKSLSGYSEAAAKAVYDDLEFTTTGRLERKAVENIRTIFIEYGILTKDKAPAVDDLFTNEYVS